LISAGTPQLNIGTPGVLQGILDIHVYRVQHVTLLSHDMSDVSKQLIQFADRLFDLADFSFSFYYQVFLKVDFALLRQLWLILLLL